ncbi:MAG: hypothetical protein COU65_00270 [Candidatus Pacebacteria bacterium CG10_big_fil_rev_8_21_14_0_10_42_12]|nr:hypothetical protein [Candidatus Paceibacterota bacterium]PIR63010.1 MAG: hypothetical protein COU65_00270 [Candidatus Pacebacteria bacterium CG10_big_fil_rev_8_21_14_0_10_42_12]
MQLFQQFRIQFILSSLLLGAAVVASVIGFQILQPVIPLYYTAAASENILASKEWIFLIPGLMLGSSVLNFLLLAFFSKSKSTIFSLFAWGSVVINVLFLALLTRIILLIW